MISFKYGVLDVRNFPGSDEAVEERMRFASAHSETEIIESGLIPLLKISDKVLIGNFMVRQFLKHLTQFFRQYFMDFYRIVYVSEKSGNSVGNI